MDHIDSVSSGSMSPDLGDMWCQGCPESPEWEGELELDSEDEEEEGDNAGSADESEDKGLEDYLKQLIESPLWVLVRDFPLFSRCLCNAYCRTQVQQKKSRIVVLPREKQEKDKSEPCKSGPA